MCEEAGVGVQPALPSVRQRSQVPSPLREKVRMRVNQRKPFIRFPSPSSSPLGGEEILGKILPFPKKNGSLRRSRGQQRADSAVAQTLKNELRRP